MEDSLAFDLKAGKKSSMRDREPLEMVVERNDSRMTGKFDMSTDSKVQPHYMEEDTKSKMSPTTQGTAPTHYTQMMNEMEASNRKTKANRESSRRS